MKPVEITAISLNCWGIAGVSKDRRPRMEAIAEHLSSGNYDFVFLQEVWVEDDYKLIAQKVTKVLPYSHYFHSGVIGGGVCIFSKSKIIDTFFHGWSLNGYIHKIHHGDWFGGKGVGICSVKHHGIRFNLYVTHLHAEYNPENDEYYAHRVNQAFETSQLIRYTGKTADVCILGADLNTEPEDLMHRIICQNSPLIDLYKCTGKPEEEGTTNETPSNSYTHHSSLRKCPYGKRIDYLMCSSREGLTIDTLNVYSPLPSRIEGTPFSYSDHEPVCAKFRILENCVTTCGNDKEECIQTLKESLVVCEAAMKTLTVDKRKYLFFFAVIAVLLVLLPFTNESFAFIHYLLMTAHLLLTLVATYCLLMGTVWNRIEKHGILASQLGMKTRLKELSDDDS